jgi:Mor family transcriptional regulator
MIKPTKKHSNPPAFVGQSYEEMDDNDFVQNVLSVVAKLVPGLNAETISKADAAVRERWGGDRPYIARRVGAGYSQRDAAIRRDYLAGERFELLERRYGLTRRRLMQIVKLG